MALTFDDSFGNISLTTHRVNRDGCLFELQHFQQSRDGGNFISLAINLQLTKNSMILMHISINHVDGSLVGSGIEALA